MKCTAWVRFHTTAPVVLLVLFAASCSSNPATSLPSLARSTTPSSNDAAVPVAAAPQPYDRAAGVERVPLPTNAMLPIAEGFLEHRARQTPMSVVGPNDHENTGIGFQGEGRYTSLFAIHQVHPGLQIAYPPGQTGTAFLYAPTTKDGCFENVTAYAASPTGTTEDLGVFDWCNNGGFVAGVNIDQHFTQLYVRKIFGMAVYVTEIYAYDLHPHVGTKWASLIYNFETNRWNEIAELQQQPAAPDYNGWSIFEFYFLPGACPPLPSVSALGLSLYDTALRRWQLITPSLPELSTSVIDGPPGSCFTNNSSEGAMYSLEKLIPYFYWLVGTDPP